MSKQGHDLTELSGIYIDTLNRGHGIISRFEQGIRAAEAIIAAGYRKQRIITAEDELAGLRQGAVILSEQGGIFQQFNGYWLEPANSYGHHLDEIALPVTVLYEPEA